MSRDNAAAISQGMGISICKVGFSRPLSYLGTAVAHVEKSWTIIFQQAAGLLGMDRGVKYCFVTEAGRVYVHSRLLHMAPVIVRVTETTRQVPIQPVVANYVAVCSACRLLPS